MAILSFGCNKSHEEAHSSVNSVADASAVTVAEFSTLDANAWVNGAPVSLAAARGKQVVLIEAWHPT